MSLSADGFQLAEQRLLVSTVGIPESMAGSARRFRSVGLALSPHSARQEVRERIIPLARRHPLPAWRAAIEAATARQGRPIMIEHIVWPGLNDAPEDLGVLLDFVRGVPVHINLIPFNPIAEARDLRPAGRTQMLSLAGQLREGGLKVTVRYSLGADIAAACGQLVQPRSPR